jgi:hypothetical protein
MLVLVLRFPWPRSVDAQNSIMAIKRWPRPTELYIQGSYKLTTSYRILVLVLRFLWPQSIDAQNYIMAIKWWPRSTKLYTYSYKLPYTRSSIKIHRTLYLRKKLLICLRMKARRPRNFPYIRCSTVFKKSRSRGSSESKSSSSWGRFDESVSAGICIFTKARKESNPTIVIYNFNTTIALYAFTTFYYVPTYLAKTL